MNLQKVTDDISVSDQLTPKDLPLVKSLGYRSVVCNRPDGEDVDQPLFESIIAAANLSDIEARYLPVPSGAGVEDSVGAMRRALRELPRPTLLYCRSGTRSAALLEAALKRSSDDA